MTRDQSPVSPPPTFKDALAFRAKATLLQIKRAALNTLNNGPARYPSSDKLSGAMSIAESTSRLWTDSNDSEGHLLAGKIHNLRLAVRQLDGVEVPAGGLFSFWAQVGRTTHRKGYERGRELREGCIIPAIGGGICQLSNALYDAALLAGFEIVERHGHTQVIPGSLAERGRDATVFWNYVDLRFISPHAFRIEATMNADSLTVRLRGDVSAESPRPSPVFLPVSSNVGTSAPQNCFSCGVHECFRHVAQPVKDVEFSRSAYLVDKYWPEFDKYLCEAKREQDLLLVPLDGNRFGKVNYAWSTKAFRHYRQSWKVALHRALSSRRIALQGPTRQRTLLAFHKKLADNYASLLPYDVTHLVVMQNLLPHLWRGGHLGGRTFDVLMTSLPLSQLQKRLDLAASMHPESRTLADFRADESLVQSESAALERARKIITPHSQIAALYEGKTVALDWIMPPHTSTLKAPAACRPRIVFPAATVGRKGAYELREALQGLDVCLTVVGTQLEGDDFWQGLSVERKRNDEDWLEGAIALVLPAHVEHKPRRLLEGIARGIPVIASTACGLGSTGGVINIPIGDVEALRHEIEKIMTATGAR